ncbi:hypothetical protein [Bacillus sp. FSL K6-0067]|uniref:hypothetical protein n=1 Tax=Bacillus sp. FSL K6-0067 TaxID=2921412 RepID=UPI000AF170FD|nr:hypothetical protein [Bacillus cereus]
MTIFSNFATEPEEQDSEKHLLGKGIIHMTVAIAVLTFLGAVIPAAIELLKILGT